MTSWIFSLFFLFKLHDQYFAFCKVRFFQNLTNFRSIFSGFESGILVSFLSSIKTKQLLRKWSRWGSPQVKQLKPMFVFRWKGIHAQIHYMIRLIKTNGFLLNWAFKVPKINCSISCIRIVAKFLFTEIHCTEEKIC